MVVPLYLKKIECCQGSGGREKGMRFAPSPQDSTTTLLG